MPGIVQGRTCNAQKHHRRHADYDMRQHLERKLDYNIASGQGPSWMVERPVNGYKSAERCQQSNRSAGYAS